MLLNGTYMLCGSVSYKSERSRLNLLRQRLMWFNDPLVNQRAILRKIFRKGRIYGTDIKKPPAKLAHSRRQENPRKTSKNAEFRNHFIIMAELLQDMKGKQNDYY